MICKSQCLFISLVKKIVKLLFNYWGTKRKEVVQKAGPTVLGKSELDFQKGSLVYTLVNDSSTVVFLEILYAKYDC